MSVVEIHLETRCLMAGIDPPTLDDLFTRPHWWEAAWCRGRPQELWFPDRGTTGREAREICTGCPARTDCLEWALAQGQELAGIFGGTSQIERRDLLQRRHPGWVS